MLMECGKEIEQTEPIAGLGEAVFLKLQRTAELLMRRLAESLKPAELTPTQYYVLRILREAEPEGLPCREIGLRLVTHDPDMTRLLDRLETRGLVRRSRGEKDRRIVFTRITGEGLALLDGLDDQVAGFIRGHLGHVGREPLWKLGDLLDQVGGPRP
jgi:MarR family transcriptional regulator, organic hydroperoxide resistance regulator